MKNKLLITFFIGMFFVTSSADEVKKSEEWKIQNDPYYKHKVSQFEMLKDRNNEFVGIANILKSDEGNMYIKRDKYFVLNPNIST